MRSALVLLGLTITELSPVLAQGRLPLSLAMCDPSVGPHLVVAGVPLNDVCGNKATANSPPSTLQGALRTLVVAEEKFWADHGTYTTDVSQLGVFKRTDSVWVQVLFAGGRSWSGRALFGKERGKSCVVYVGWRTDFPSAPVTERDSVLATQEGLPACDKF